MLQVQLSPKENQVQYDTPVILDSPKPNFVVQPPLLGTLIAEQENLPAYSMIMGICDDNLPLVWDFSDPASGSILIIGDDEFYNTNLLHTLITSITATNKANEVNFHLISPFVNQVVTFQQSAHYKLGFEPNHPDCNIVIEEFVRLVKSRQKGDSILPMHVLAIDNVDQLVSEFSKQDRANFEWLLINGPAFGVWTIATSTTNQLANSNTIKTKLFKSKMISQIRNTATVKGLGKLVGNHPKDLIAGCEAIMIHQKSPRHIWIPQLEDLGFGYVG